jgi:hypothetical protein
MDIGGVGKIITKNLCSFIILKAIGTSNPQH